MCSTVGKSVLSVIRCICTMYTAISYFSVIIKRFARSFSNREPKRGTTIWPECTASTSSTASTRAIWPHSSTRTWDGRTWASAGVRPRPSHVRPAAGSAWPPRCRCPSSTCAEPCRRTKRTRWRSTRDWIRPSRRGWRWAPLYRYLDTIRITYIRTLLGIVIWIRGSQTCFYHVPHHVYCEWVII